MAVVQGRIEAGTVGRGRGRVSVVCCGRDVREVFKQMTNQQRRCSHPESNTGPATMRKKNIRLLPMSLDTRPSYDYN